MNSNRTLATPRRNVGDFDASGADTERDWVKRTACWTSVERVLRTYGRPSGELNRPGMDMGATVRGAVSREARQTVTYHPHCPDSPG